MTKSTHRSAIGITLALMLPVCMLGSLPVSGKPDYWWYTISDTYWYCSGFSLMMGACSILLFLYTSYSRLDNIVNILTGITAVGHIIFPCSDPYGLPRIGFLQLSPSTSESIHNTLSVIMILLEAFNVAFLFTRGDHRKANLFYRICAVVMLVCLSCFGLCKAGVLPAPAKFPFEITIVYSVSLCWMVKGHLFSKGK